MLCSNTIHQTDETSFCSSIGHSTISNEEVNNAIDALVERITPLYLDCIQENSANNHKDLFKYGSKPSFQLSIYSSQEMNMQNTKDGRFYYKTQIYRKNLDDKDAFSHLLVNLSDQLLALEYTDFDTGYFDIRFEKGHLGKTVYPIWHFDVACKTAITVCWSNIESWCTRVKPFMKTKPEDFSLDYHKSRDDKAELTQFGFLYDALKTYHRAPCESDFSSKPQINDRRLFIRYVEI